MDQALAMTQVLVGAADQVASGLHGLRDGRRHRVAARVRSTGWRRAPTASCATPSPRCSSTGIDPMMVIRWKDIFETLERRSTPARPSPTCSRASP